MCAKEDANAQGKMQTRKGRSAQEQVQWQFGELQRGNCERGTMLMSTGGNCQT